LLPKTVNISACNRISRPSIAFFHGTQIEMKRCKVYKPSGFMISSLMVMRLFEAAILTLYSLGRNIECPVFHQFFKIYDLEMRGQRYSLSSLMTLAK
jgi:hypothetical protein